MKLSIGHRATWVKLLRHSRSDNAVAALCWAVAFATCMGVLLIPCAHLITTAAVVWLMNLIRAYREKEAPPSPWCLLPCMGLLIGAAPWCTDYLLILLTPAVFIYALSLVFKSPALRHTLHDAAVVLACAAPAAAHSFEITPFSLFSYTPVWLVVVLMWVQRVTADEGCQKVQKLRWKPFIGFLVLMFGCVKVIYEGYHDESCFAVSVIASAILIQGALLAGRRFIPSLQPLVTSPLLLALPPTLLFFFSGTTRLFW